MTGVGGGLTGVGGVTNVVGGIAEVAGTVGTAGNVLSAGSTGACGGRVVAGIGTTAPCWGTIVGGGGAIVPEEAWTGEGMDLAGTFASNGLLSVPLMKYSMKAPFSSRGTG